MLAQKKRFVQDIKDNPELRNTHKFYEMSPRDIQE